MIIFFKEFRFTSRKIKSVEQINQELTDEIRQHKVAFLLDSANEKTLREAGANDLMIKTIRENKSDNSQLKEDSEKLYELFSTHIEENLTLEKLSQILEIEKDYVKKYEYFECQKEIIDYLKESIPLLEKQISLLTDNQKRRKKDDEKYRILKDLTDKFKAKNWDEVFALGKKVSWNSIS